MPALIPHLSISLSVLSASLSHIMSMNPVLINPFALELDAVGALLDINQLCLQRIVDNVTEPALDGILKWNGIPCDSNGKNIEKIIF
jgi:hypothetical protein